MKRYLPTAIALLFVFVFVFSLAATITADVTAMNYTCGECCIIPAKGKCTLGAGQLINGKCDCIPRICMVPPYCTYKCPVCE